MDQFNAQTSLLSSLWILLGGAGVTTPLTGALLPPQYLIFPPPVPNPALPS